METAKVDIQKLQLLNDRIAQCFDALNQVRLSVHGLSHTAAQAGIGQQGFVQPGFGQQSFGPQMGQQGFPYQQNPYLTQAIGQNPFAQGIGQQSVPWANPLGLAHSTYGVPSPYAQATPYTQVPQMPFGAIGIQPGIGAQTPFGVGPIGVNPFVNPYLGLSHTNPIELELYTKPLWADPLLAVRVAQTFPFVQLPISPAGV
jgi:hypothetical protein